VVNFTDQLLYLQERILVPTEEKAGWATELLLGHFGVEIKVFPLLEGTSVKKLCKIVRYEVSL
jgi:hypothetical protein